MHDQSICADAFKAYSGILDCSQTCRRLLSSPNASPSCRLPKDVQKRALPEDASCEDLDVDPSLVFLSQFVQAALQNGAAPYISEADRFEMGAVRPTHQDNAADQTHALRFAAYERSPAPEQVSVRTVSRDPSPVRGEHHETLILDSIYPSFSLKLLSLSCKISSGGKG